MATRAQACARVHRIMVDASWGGYNQGGNRIGLTPTQTYDVLGVSKAIPAHDMDCSSSTALAVWVVFGYLPYTYTGNEYAGLTSHGWKAHKVDQHKCWDGYVPKAGDIVLRNGQHTAMFQSPTVISEFRINELGKATGGKPGDQTGRESCVTDYYSTSRWDWIFECPAGEWGATSKSSGWVEKNGGWWYRHADGSCTKSGWEKVGGEWYLFDGDGWMRTGWAEVGGKWYYLHEAHDGRYGAMDTGWVQVGGKWYFLTKSGAMATGWLQRDGKWYWLDPDSGAMHESDAQYIGGKWYAFGSDGEMRYHVDADQSGALRL